MSQPDNPPAFPGQTKSGVQNASGMTLRDWFAGQALPRTLSSEYMDTSGSRVDGARHERAAVETAYRISDLMLAERKKTG